MNDIFTSNVQYLTELQREAFLEGCAPEIRDRMMNIKLNRYHVYLTFVAGKYDPMTATGEYNFLYDICTPVPGTFFSFIQNHLSACWKDMRITFLGKDCVCFKIGDDVIYTSAG